MTKFQNTSDIKTNVFHKGMNKDSTDIFMPEGVWTHARNAINNSHYGELGSISNEQGNKLCTTVGLTNYSYAIIGFAYMNNRRWIIFSTDNVHSEIGIFDENDNSYTEVYNDIITGSSDYLLGFRYTNLITAVCKENYDCTWSVYWQDGHNVDRVINIDHVLEGDRPPFKQVSGFDPCNPEYENFIDIDLLRLHPLVQQPCIQTKRSDNDGQLLNGSYMVCISYSEKGIRLTDYSLPSNPQPLWREEGLGGSLEIRLDNLDTNYYEIELVLIFNANQQTIAKKVGNYSIPHQEETLTINLDQVLESLPTVELSSIPLKSIIYDKSDKMFEINNYLIRSGVTTHPFFNYQEQANEIDVNWVNVEYPASYYKNGGNKAGYMRDEVYSFFIRFVYNTGARSASFHIPGREAVPSELDVATGSNVVRSGERVFETSDTSSITSSSLTDIIDDKDVAEGRIIQKGTMGYWESTERYPSNPVIWGDLCGQQIRHHKMPSEKTIPIFKEGGQYIHILGIEFDNIEYPLDRDGNPVDGIVGYEILRGSREGNRSIVAKGMFNNMMQFNIPYSNPTQQALMQNYPYNDVGTDPFLTNDINTLTNPNSGQPTGLSTYVNNIFSFHSPDTTFRQPYLGSNYVQVYHSINGKSRGYFEVPYQHPKFKLLRDSSLVTAGVLGIGIGLLAAMGKTTFTTDTGVTTPVAKNTGGSDGELGIATGPAGYVAQSVMEVVQTALFANPGAIASLATKVAGAALFVSQLSYFSGMAINEILAVIRNFSKYRDHMLQYNSHGFYDNHGNYDIIRRVVPVEGLKYIGSGVQSWTDSLNINNLNRNKYVCVQTNNSISLLTGDNSKYKPTTSNIEQNIVKNIVSYYGALKVHYANQYGQLSSIIQMPVGSCVHSIEPGETATSPVIFGGDTYINRYTEKNPYYFFNTWLRDVPDGIEYDYRNYVNGPIPQYWIDSNVYDTSDFQLNFGFLNSSDPTDPANTNGTLPNIVTPKDFYRLDNTDSGVFVIKKGWAYLFYNGVRDFFVESEINLAYRESGQEPTQRFYNGDGGFSDLSLMFRSDKITASIFHKYDWSMSASKLFNNFASWGNLLRADYDDEVYENCFEYLPRRVIYSLQQQEGMRRDNWRNYLPLNYKDFGSKVSVMKELNKTGAIILFEDGEPIQFQGVDKISTESGQKFTIGDGGLFQGDPNSLVNADDSLRHAYCISSRSAINTPFGMFFISQQSGSIFQYTGEGFQDITRNGMKFWFKENLPSRFLNTYSDYPLYDNPVVGIGCQAIYDPDYELIYFTKRDLIPLHSELLFEESTGRPYIIDSELGRCYVDYTSDCFIDCSWTASYDPKIQAWVSFHDWHPSLMMQSSKHFLTIDPISKSSIWRHNNRVDIYNRYYARDYGWEIEYPFAIPNNVSTLRNIEYNLEVFKFQNNRDGFHVLDTNFDEMIIYNSEQISGLIKLILKEKNNPYSNLTYPRIHADYIESLYSKEEQKYRVNHFWDITNDRGEFSGEEDITMWSTEENGYIKNLNEDYLDYDKPVFQRKKFRHYGNKVLLRTLPVEQDKKMVLKLVNNKVLNSSR